MTMKNDFIVPVACRICDGMFEIYCNEADYNKWKSGEGYIQETLHYLSPDQRELLISATCGECFDSLSPPEDEE